jgi:hypothetical protein
MHPLHAAMSRRRAHHLDASLIAGKDPVPGHAPDGDLPADKALSENNPSDTKGDLAPDVSDDLQNQGDTTPEAAELDNERKAMHSQMGQNLKAEVAQHEQGNPEHEPVPRNPMLQDALGHEESLHDDAFEHMMQGTHNPTLQRPKTLAARVAAAIHAKNKGKR